MISKWFIGVSAKSKGFITGWNSPSRYNWRSSNDEIDKIPKPSFTKQSALATSYNTKEEADKILNEIKVYNGEDLMATYEVYEWAEKHCC